MVVLVHLEPQSGQLGHHERGEARVNERREPLSHAHAEQQLGQFVASTLRGHDLEPPSKVRHCGERCGLDLEPQLRHEPRPTHHPQRVIAKRDLGLNRRAQQPAGEVLEATERVNELPGGQAHRHGVDGEIAPREVVEQRRPKGNGRLAGLAVIRVGAIRSDLYNHIAAPRADGPKLAPHVPRGARPPGEQRLCLLGQRGRREVEIRR